MPTQPLPNRPIDESFQDALPILYDEVKKYLRSNPHTRLSRDECVSIVFESFSLSYDGHIAEKGMFLQRVRFLARHAITDYLRSQKNKIKPLQDNGNLHLVPQKSSFDPIEFRRSLSEDADKLLWVVQHLDIEEGWSDDRKKNLVLKAMADKGWPGDRVVVAWNEIAMMLADWYRDHSQ